MNKDRSSAQGIGEKGLLLRLQSIYDACKYALDQAKAIHPACLFLRIITLSLTLKKRIARLTRRFRRTVPVAGSVPAAKVQFDDIRVEQLYASWNAYLPTFIEATVHYQTLKSKVDQLEQRLEDLKSELKNDNNG